jgi:hypothetical protein
MNARKDSSTLGGSLKRSNAASDMEALVHVTKMKAVQGNAKAQRNLTYMMEQLGFHDEKSEPERHGVLVVSKGRPTDEEWFYLANRPKEGWPDVGKLIASTKCFDLLVMKVLINSFDSDSERTQTALAAVSMTCWRNRVRLSFVERNSAQRHLTDTPTLVLHHKG